MFSCALKLLSPKTTPLSSSVRQGLEEWLREEILTLELLAAHSTLTADNLERRYTHTQWVNPWCNNLQLLLCMNSSPCMYTGCSQESWLLSLPSPRPIVWMADTVSQSTILHCMNCDTVCVYPHAESCDSVSLCVCVSSESCDSVSLCVCVSTCRIMWQCDTVCVYPHAESCDSVTLCVCVSPCRIMWQCDGTPDQRSVAQHETLHIPIL